MAGRTVDGGATETDRCAGIVVRVERYACGQVGSEWTETARLIGWLEVWQAATAAVDHPFDEWTDWLVRDLDSDVGWRARGWTLETRYGHDVAAACEALRETLHGLGAVEPARWLHYGLCSSDVADGGLWLTARAVTAELEDLADVAITSLLRLESEQLEEQVVHRTHGQAAQVGFGGLRWSRHRQNLAAATRSMKTSAVRLSLPAFNGPTGTGGVLTVSQRRAIRAKLAGSEQGAGSAAAGQNVGRDDYVQWAQAVSRLATACERFGRDVRLLAATGVDEVSEGRGPEYRGSSSMPHKHNPTRSERLCGLAPVVRGLVAGYQEAAAECWDSHSLEHSSAERVVLPQITELTGFMLREVYEIADTLVIHPGEVAENVDVAPADSFARRNELVREGVDGQAAYEATRAELPELPVNKLLGPF